MAKRQSDAGLASALDWVGYFARGFETFLSRRLIVFSTSLFK
jgi:hypothetical protein